jgi:hypothetical protein
MNAPKAIVQRHDSNWLTTSPVVGAAQVYVLSYKDGRLVAFTRRPTFADRVGSTFCYVVDTAEQRTSFSTTAPSRQDAYPFTVQADVVWRVVDAEALVRSGVDDAAQVVRSAVDDQLWTVGRRFAPDDAAGAEQAGRQAFPANSAVSSGLALVRVLVRMTPYAGLTGAVRQADSVRHDGAIGLLKMQQESDRMHHMRTLLDGDESLLLLHLANNRSDTGSVIQLMLEARQRGETTRMELFDRMVANNFIQDADVEPLRRALLGGSGPGMLTPTVGLTSSSMRAIIPGDPVPPAAASPSTGGATGSVPPPAPAAGAGPADNGTPDPAGGKPSIGHVREWKPLMKRDGDRS